MGGIVRSIQKAVGGSSEKDKRELLASRQQSAADEARARATAERKQGESEAALQRATKKRRTVGRRSTILTSPLGTVDTSLASTLG